MADLQVGTTHGFPVATVSSRVLATVTADGVNTVDVDSIDRLELGMLIDIAHKTTGAVLAAARTITVLDAVNKRVTYSGADVTATTSHGFVLSGKDITTNASTNVNGGGAQQSGFFDKNLQSIDLMRTRLKVINATYYTDPVLNMMTVNDMAFAIRTSDYPTTIKQ